MNAQNLNEKIEKLAAQKARAHQERMWLALARVVETTAVSGANDGNFFQEDMKMMLAKSKGGRPIGDMRCKLLVIVGKEMLSADPNNDNHCYIGLMIQEKCRESLTMY